MVRIEEVLQVAMDSRASDIHLTAGLPPKMRVNGHLLNMDFPVLKPEDTLDIVGQIMTEHQKQMFEERGELDMSFAVTNLGRYRVNAFRQRGSVAMALRAVNTVIPTPAQLGVPNAVVDLYNRKRGLVLVTLLLQLSIKPITTEMLILLHWKTLSSICTFTKLQWLTSVR